MSYFATFITLIYIFMFETSHKRGGKSKLKSLRRELFIKQKNENDVKPNHSLQNTALIWFDKSSNRRALVYHYVSLHV